MEYWHELRERKIFIRLALVFVGRASRGLNIDPGGIVGPSGNVFSMKFFKAW